MENQQLSAIITDKDKEINSLQAIIKDLKAQVTYHAVEAKCLSLMYADRTRQLQKERAQAAADMAAILGPDCREKYLALRYQYGPVNESATAAANKAAKPVKKKAISAPPQQGLFL